MTWLLLLASWLLLRSDGSGEPESDAGESDTSGGPGEPAPSVDDGPRMWSLTAGGPLSICGMAIAESATSDWGAVVKPSAEGPVVWGWTPPGDLRAGELYGARLVADVEYRPYVPAAPQSAWAGDELEEAAAIADLVGGVTSHGFVPKKLRPVLQAFAERGCTGYPQVYDTDKSAEPRSFLRNCIKSWRAAGFTSVRPLLGLSAGPDHIAAWIEVCAEEGVPYDLYSLQRYKSMDLGCDDLTA